MKQNVKITFSFLAAVIGSFCVQADDVAGLMRVESDTNGEVTVEMPFTPFGDGTIPTFLSGTFFGDGAPFGFWLRGRVAPECSGRTHRRQMIGLLGGISQKVSGRYQHLV